MDTDRINTNVNSEVGELEAVILHKPGVEIEQMTPTNAKDALYSDILNLTSITPQYEQLAGVLSKVATTLYVKDLLKDTLSNEEAKRYLLSQIVQHEISEEVCQMLSDFDNATLSDLLIEGYIDANAHQPLTFFLKPLYNLFFTRDASMSIGNKVLIANMASKVRDREALVMDTIFRYNPVVKTSTINLPNRANTTDFKIEGGDVLVVRNDLLLIGTGLRSSMSAILELAETFKNCGHKHHIIVQQLPSYPESFIHLDMVFTMLDVDKCMLYKPVIMNNNLFTVTHIEIEGDKITCREESNLVEAMQRVLGYEMKITCCGGDRNPVFMEREQWHSGANFFAMGQGKVIGYGQNIHTIEALNNSGFEVITAADVIAGKRNLNDYNRYVVTIEGSETSRGGGGCRCMTMPIRRREIIL